MTLRRVSGIGGVFIKARGDAAALRDWYARHLGIAIEPWGGHPFSWAGPDNPGGIGTTVWCVFDAASDYCGAAPGAVMVNYRVPDLEALLAALRAEGCAVDERVESSELGRFGWVTDPEGNRIELWQPPAGS